MAEIWKPVKGYEKLYIVSNYGDIKSIRSGKILKPRLTPTGYCRVNLPQTIDGKRDAYVHRIVADAFCIHPDGCNVVNHKDNNPTNNNASNLEWVTQRANVHYGMKQNRYKMNARSVVGCKDGIEYVFDSLRNAALSTGCDHSTISKCCRNKKRTTHGYSWRFAEVT